MLIVSVFLDKASTFCIKPENISCKSGNGPIAQNPGIGVVFMGNIGIRRSPNRSQLFNGDARLGFFVSAHQLPFPKNNSGNYDYEKK